MAMTTRKPWARLLWSATLGALAISIGLFTGDAASAGVPDSKATPPADKPWNILVITSDEHNPKILGAAGNPVVKTPGIDRLAREGLMCTKMYASDPICAPTRQSLMTGNYPQEHGQFTNSYVFNENTKTWAHHFKNHGYATACIGKMHTNNEQCKFGFDYRGPGGRAAARSAKKTDPAKTWDPEDKKAYDASPDTRFSGMVLNDPLADIDGRVADDSIRWLKENRDQRFFLHVSMVKPHWPWDAPREFYYMYDPAKIDFPKIVPDYLDENYAPRMLKQNYDWGKITEAMHRVYRARYYGSLSWMDHNVERVLETVDQLGLAGRTLVIYTTDHGDMAGEKGLWLKSLMFDASVRIPLVLRMPGVLPAGKTCDALLNHVDLFPTIAGLTGTAQDLPGDLTGKDRSQVLLGKAEGPRFTFSVHEVRGAKELPGQVMARSQRWKLIYYPRVEQEKDRYVLYDMQADPDETTNLANRPEYAGTVAEHKQAIDTFLAGLKQPPYPPKKMGGEQGEGKAGKGKKGVNRFKRT